jgi:hypothetical protein
MKRESVILVSVLATAGIMIGCVIAQKFFGLSEERTIMLGGVAAATMLGFFMRANRRTYGVWIRQPEQQAMPGAGLKRMRWGYALGLLALVPVVIVVVLLGADPNIMTTLATGAGLAGGAVLLGWNMLHHRKASRSPE